MEHRDFRYYLRVRYSECDAQQVVFNARYADYAGLAAAEFLRAVGLHDELNRGRLGTQVVRMLIEWKAGARFDQILELSVRVTHVGTTSFTFYVAIRVAGSDAVIATAEIVCVLIDERVMKKQALPESYRGVLASGAPGAVTDHAGYLAVS